MSATTSIEWCDSTFNPWIGCTKISPACDHCYAETLMDKRMGRARWGAGQPRVRTSVANWRKPLAWNHRADAFRECAACGWRGDLAVRDKPLAFACPSCAAGDWRPARRRVFCASLADVFDNEVDPQWRVVLLELIRETPNLDWLLLTKRIGNAHQMLSDSLSRLAGGAAFLPAWPWPNVWLGATICNQAEADRDIPKLLAVPATRRFLSIEPMLGPIDLERACDIAEQGVCAGTWDDMREPTRCLDALRHGSVALLDWIIAGGESGPHARPAHPDWFRSLRDQCAAAGMPFLFKQWGEWAPHTIAAGGDMGADMRSGRVRFVQGDGRPPDGHFRRGDAAMERVGKRRAGRLLDGREHNGFPA